MIIYQEAFPYNVYHQYSVPHFLKQLRIYVLVLNLGHSPLYRHFCKYLYIELLKFRLFFNYYIHFLRSTIRKQAFIVLTYRKCWHIANPLYFMVFGFTRQNSNKFGSALIGTTIRSSRMLKKSLQPLNILNKGCTSAIQASLIVFDLHFLCTICRICYKVLYYGNRTVQWRCLSAFPPSGTGECLPYHILYIFSAKSEKTILILFFQFSGTSSQEFHFLTNL